jgi:hypothetical protein
MLIKQFSMHHIFKNKNDREELKTWKNSNPKLIPFYETYFQKN